VEEVLVGWVATVAAVLEAVELEEGAQVAAGSAGEGMAKVAHLVVVACREAVVMAPMVEAG
jgi:hypothetical protein